jgi:MATE family multidrug resistance protein
MIKWFKQRYSIAGGYKEFFKIAVPLIISTGAWSFQHFLNRLFLAWHNAEEFAAALPAGVLSFTILSLFVGTVVYVDVFVAQYWGKRDYKAIGPAVWQSVYLALAGGIIVFGISLFTRHIFTFTAHPPEIRAHEITYFKTLAYGAFFALASGGMGGFYAGRGLTKVVVIVNAVGVGVNILLDYVLIFGKWGFPQMGIKGAALATVLGAATMAAIFFCLIVRRQNNFSFNTRSFKPDFAFIKKLFKFGFPNGVQFFTDMSAFAFFVFMVGSLGGLELTASSIALNINYLAFMPITGFGITVSILVGQYLGRNKANIAEIAAYTGIQVALMYGVLVITAYLLFGGIFVDMFLKGTQAAQAELIKPVALNLLLFVCVYTIFDPLNITSAAAIKGAGDTSFVMKALITLSILLLIIPSYVAIIVLKIGLYSAWTIMLVYAAALALTFYRRFLGGKWRKMRVIDMEIKD